MKSERVENWWCGFEWCILSTEKLWSSNKFKKMKSLCNRQVSVWNPNTSKEIVRYTKCIQFFLSASLLSCTFYVGEMMTPCQLSTFSEFICSAFHFQCHIAQKNEILCNIRVSVWNPDTSKEIVRFVHEVHLVFAVTLSTFLHMLCGSNDDTVPSFNLFRVHLKWFPISGSYS